MNSVPPPPASMLLFLAGSEATLPRFVDLLREHAATARGVIARVLIGFVERTEPDAETTAELADLARLGSEEHAKKFADVPSARNDYQVFAEWLEARLRDRFPELSASADV